jgi:hypothetical protein
MSLDAGSTDLSELAAVEIAQVVLTARREGGFKVMVMSLDATEWDGNFDDSGAAVVIAALIREGKWKGVSL